MDAKDIFSNAQIEYLNRTYSPESIDDYLPNWIVEGEVYISNWIDVSLECESSKDALIKLYVLHRSHQIREFLPYSEDVRGMLNDNLKQVQKRQLRDKNNVAGKIVSSTDKQKFTDEFFIFR